MGACNCLFLFSTGVVLGILTGMRGLCMGLGPAIFGLFFYLSHVHLDEQMVVTAKPVLHLPTALRNATTPTPVVHTVSIQYSLDNT